MYPGNDMLSMQLQTKAEELAVSCEMWLGFINANCLCPQQNVWVISKSCGGIVSMWRRNPSSVSWICPGVSFQMDVLEAPPRGDIWGAP